MKISKAFKFEAAHRLISSYTKACQNIHGHSYRVIIEIDHVARNEDGMVMDFKKLKDIANPLFDLLDHSTIFCDKDDKFISAFINCLDLECVHIDNWNGTTVDIPLVLMSDNPTAENMAVLFHKIVSDRIAEAMPEFIHSDMTIRVFETLTSEASYNYPIFRSK